MNLAFIFPQQMITCPSTTERYREFVAAFPLLQNHQHTWLEQTNGKRAKFHRT